MAAGCAGGPKGPDLLGFITNPIGAIIDMIAQLLVGAAMEIYAVLTRMIPGLDTGASQRIDGQTQWIVVYLAVGSLLYAAARMAYERRGNAGEAALKGVLRLVFVSAAGTAVIGAAAMVSENFSNHLYTLAVKEMLTGIGCTTSGGAVTGILLLVLAFLLLISAIVQVVLLYIRLGVMIVLLGTLPVAAAASMTDWGVGWWRKHLGWMMAWILYKPAAGLVMYAGATLISSSADVNKKLAGIGLMLLAAVALPALLKIIVPAVAALGSGGGDQRGVSPGMGMAASGAKKIGGGAAAAGVALAQKGMRGASGASDKGPSGGTGQGGKSGVQPLAAKQGGGGQAGGGRGGGGQGGGQSGGQGEGGLPTGARRPSTGGGAPGGGGGGGNPVTQGGGGAVPASPHLAAAQVAQKAGNAMGRVARGASNTIAGAVNNPEYDENTQGPSGANR